MPVGPGDVIALTQEQYKYGRGDVSLYVTDVRREFIDDYDGQWVWLDGYELLSNGARGDERRLLVRISALPGGTA